MNETAVAAAECSVWQNLSDAVNLWMCGKEGIEKRI